VKLAGCCYREEPEEEEDEDEDEEDEDAEEDEGEQEEQTMAAEADENAKISAKAAGDVGTVAETVAASAETRGAKTFPCVFFLLQQQRVMVI